MRPPEQRSVREATTMRQRNLLMTALVLGAVLLAACSSGSGHSATNVTTTTAATITCAGWGGPTQGGRQPGVARGQRVSDVCLRLNQVQVIGTHNSYHLEDPPKLLNVIKAFSTSTGESIEYSHPA